MSAESIKIYVGVTDLEWFEYLSMRNPDEVNFWQPSGRLDTMIKILSEAAGRMQISLTDLPRSRIPPRRRQLARDCCIFGMGRAG